MTEQKKLTNEESEGLLKIVSDYAYALDVLDQYDYQSLKISDTSEGELYQNHLQRGDPKDISAKKVLWK